MLFVIQWLGGVYCVKKMNPLDDNDWAWVVCIFIGWIFIIYYLYQCLTGGEKTSSSSNSSPSSSDNESLSPDNDYNTSQNISDATLSEQTQDIHKQAASNTISNEPDLVNDFEYMELLKQYYSKYGEEAFLPSKIQDFIASNQFDSNLGIKSDDVMKDLLKISRTANIASEQTATQPKETGQSQAASQTPPVQEQSKQVITEDAEPPQSILDAQKLFNYVKAMPVKWGYANPNVTPTKELQQLCSSFLTSWEIPKCYSPDSIQGMEYIIQRKRAKTPDKADYNKVMETNMLFELYKYSYSMNIIKVLVDRKNDTVKINMSELMGLIQEDCRRHLSNLEYEKKTNPAIQDMLQKYNYDTQKVKMIINTYVEGREYDYIFSSLMTSTLMNIVNYILNTEMETADGYQPTLQIVRQYPSSDFTAALDAYISSFIGMALNSYTNGGSIPRKPQ